MCMHKNEYKYTKMIRIIWYLIDATSNKHCACCVLHTPNIHVYMQVKWLLKDVEFVVVPVVNPDGYVVRNVTNCIRVHVCIYQLTLLTLFILSKA